MNITEQTKIEMGIGFMIGIIISLVATFVIVVFFSGLVWYWKLFSAIGLVGMLGTQILALSQLFQDRKVLLSFKNNIPELKLGDKNESV